MRYIRYITDIPFWFGFPIFLSGSLLTSYGLAWYIVGVFICSFGCWTFSKNLKENDLITSGSAIVCLPIMASSLWFLNENVIDYIWPVSFETSYVIKTSVSLFFGFIAFQGFRK